jgi:protein-ribulosamine 3-kinase
MISDLQSRLEKILSELVKLSTTVYGGCIADSKKIEVNSLKLFFLKLALWGKSEMFESEAQGLEELRKAIVLSVPEVIANEDEFLLLEWIEEWKDTNDSSMEILRFQFAELHRFHVGKFGFMQENIIGDSPQINIPSSKGSEN